MFSNTVQNVHEYNTLAYEKSKVPLDCHNKYTKHILTADDNGTTVTVGIAAAIITTEALFK